MSHSPSSFWCRRPKRLLFWGRLFLPNKRAALSLCGALVLLLAAQPLLAETPSRPNILWISAEDLSPDLGCYGDPYARTPHLDRFAQDCARYTHCFSHAGVCAPARSGLITGMYPPSIGTQHMRCQGIPSAEVKCFSEYLRAAGYYCTNQAKTDYQFVPPITAWDQNGAKADWSNRAPGQPFFAVINFTTSHESQIRDPSPATRKLIAALPASSRHDPAKALVPPYYPDTPVVRRDLANYADAVSAMDSQVGQVLERLEQEGLAENTIVWFWGDHGRGLPRCKRWLYDSGTLVPLLIRVPPAWRTLASPQNPARWETAHTNDDLVAFVDFAPTVLSLAGVPLPSHLQGQAFLGPQAKPPRQYVYGHRDRMDEAYDLIRTVRDQRYRYFRNFMPEAPYAQRINYMDQMPTMQELRRLAATGELSPEAALFFRPQKPLEELYDTETDPHQLHNLADDPGSQPHLLRLRAELQRWMVEIQDTGLIPEATLDELKRPNGVIAPTAAPGVAPVEASPSQIQLTCTTPGASIAYRISGKNAPANPTKSWKLFVNPLILEAGQQLEAKAIRIGFAESPVVKYHPGDSPIAAAQESAPPFWQDVLRRDQTLARLLSLHAIDNPLTPPSEQLLNALKDPSPAVRYWSVRKLTSQEPSPTGDAQEIVVFETLLSQETAPEVRIALAQALGQWGKADLAVPVLAELLSHSHDSVGLLAALGLESLGPAAKPALPQIKIALNKGEYTGRVCERLVKSLATAD